MSRAPYKYLDYYTSADADLFFGREKETQMMVGEILSSRLLVLFARSGSGKTSLINAGVVPELKRRGYETLYVRFESDPFTSLQNAAREQLQHAGAVNDLRGLLQNVTAARKKPLVVFLDQFEEFFLVFADQPALRQDFMAQIASVKYDEQLPVFLVLSLREDYYASLHEFRSAIPSIFQNNANIRLGAFTDEEAKRAILLPLATIGLQMEAGLADRIIHDLKQNPPGQKAVKEKSSGIEPITLQIVCHKLWQMKPDDATTMTAAVYEKCGGAQKILRNHVSELLQKIPLGQQGLMVRIFEALKTRDNTKLYRRLQDLQETLRIADSRRLKNALQKLAEIGVLRHEQRSGDDWYEFKHDDLVPEVTAWIQARRERINRNRLIYATSPAILFVLVLSGFLFYQFNTFYLRFSGHEYTQQEAEIIITRGKPFQRIGVTSTGYLESDLLKDPQVGDEIESGYKIGLWQKSNWRPLADKLNLAAGGKFLYRIGEEQAGIDTLVAVLKYVNFWSEVADALVKLGRSDEWVISRLLTVLKDQRDEDIRGRAAYVLIKLGQIDEQAIDGLLTALKAQNEYSRSQTVGALDEIRSTDERVIDILLAALKDEKWIIQEQATDVLVKLGQSDKQVIGRLFTALKDQNEYVRVHAVTALIKLDQSDEQVIGGLLTALKTQNKYVQGQAAIALGEIKSTDARMMGALLATLKNAIRSVRENAIWSVRVQAASALIKLGQSEEQVIGDLLTALKAQNKNVRAEAVRALSEIKSTDERMIKGLLAALNDQSASVREQAIGALGEIKSTDERVIRGLLAALKNKDRADRIHAAIALGKIKSMDVRVIDGLLTALNNLDIDISANAANALGEIKSTDARVIDALLVALKRPSLSKSNKASIAEALIKLGLSNKQVISGLFAVLKDQDKNVQTRAANALVKLGQSDEQVINLLLAALKDQSLYIRWIAVDALGEIKSTDARVISGLLAALKDEDSIFREKAAASLGKLERTNPLPQLLAQLAHPLSGYRTAAAQALAQKDIPIDSTLQVIAKLKEDERPWVRLGAWEAYELLEPRREAEKKSAELLHEADSLFASGQWLVASGQYESAFESNPKVTHTDSLNAARTEFQQARCAAKLKRVVPALDDLKMAFEYNPTWRDTLQTEMAQPNNDWAILQGNWYLREVLLKR